MLEVFALGFEVDEALFTLFCFRSTCTEESVLPSKSSSSSEEDREYTFVLFFDNAGRFFGKDLVVVLADFFVKLGVLFDDDEMGRAVEEVFCFLGGSTSNSSSSLESKSA